MILNQFENQLKTVTIQPKFICIQHIQSQLAYISKTQSQIHLQLHCSCSKTLSMLLWRWSIYPNQISITSITSLGNTYCCHQWDKYMVFRTTYKFQTQYKTSWIHLQFSGSCSMVLWVLWVLWGCITIFTLHISPNLKVEQYFKLFSPMWQELYWMNECGKKHVTWKTDSNI